MLVDKALETLEILFRGEARNVFPCFRHKLTNCMEEVILKRFLHCVLAQDVDKPEEKVLAPILAPNFMVGRLRLMR